MSETPNEQEGTQTGGEAEGQPGEQSAPGGVDYSQSSADIASQKQAAHDEDAQRLAEEHGSSS